MTQNIKKDQIVAFLSSFHRPRYSDALPSPKVNFPANTEPVTLPRAFFSPRLAMTPLPLAASFPLAGRIGAFTLWNTRPAGAQKARRAVCSPGVCYVLWNDHLLTISDSYPVTGARMMGTMIRNNPDPDGTDPSRGLPCVAENHRSMTVPLPMEHRIRLYLCLHLLHFHKQLLHRYVCNRSLQLPLRHLPSHHCPETAMSHNLLWESLLRY